MDLITKSIKEVKEYKGLVASLVSLFSSTRVRPCAVTGLCDTASAAVYASLAGDVRKATGKTMLLVVPDEKTQARIGNAMTSLGIRAQNYPYRDLLFHNITSSHEYEYERLSALYALIKGETDVVISTPDALIQYTMPRKVLESSVMKVTEDGRYETSDLVGFLERSGYTRAETVETAGQYAVRGGIVDVFSPSSRLPLRVELFGDEVELMGLFDPMTQRRVERIKEYELTPCREVVFGAEKRAELIDAVGKAAKKTKDESVKTLLESELESLKNNEECNFTDKYLSFIYPEKESLLTYAEESCLFVVHSVNAVSDRLKAYEWQTAENVKELLASGGLDPKYAQITGERADFEVATESVPTLLSETFLTDFGHRKLSSAFNFPTKSTVSYFDNLDLLVEDLEHYISGKYGTVILTESEARARALYELLADRNITSVVCASEPKEFVPGIPYIIYDVLLGGFELVSTRFVCLSLYANSGLISRTEYRKKARKTGKKSSRERIMSYTDLSVGDYVVHTVHGIGQYLGLHTLTVDRTTRDFVKIQYAGNDLLYLPCTQLDTISKYIGAKAEDGGLKLSKMGGTEWVKQKRKVKAAAKEMAKELIALYAERTRKKGYAFDPDDAMQSEFESGFEFDETEGQLAAVADIKKDMEARYPMDRLLCGDVGFGKTEVALRAAFKAVANSKQVALLVPTTILALQHYQTISSRMRGFPVKIGMLSRFASKKAQGEIVRQLRRGECDIVVGTHRLLSKDIVFKDLGLVIVDEEQRFGVAHKEKLKTLTRNVDVLTLTATPIPRTLNMAMSGIRDMSILEEAPGDRLPVQSYVLEYDEVIIGEAIKKELRRGGQVFYLHNNIETIPYAAARVRAMAPDARIAVAHGRMEKEELSDLWRSLVTGDIDVFVSTTIIESGVDVPNANTLIVENAERFGLSQLHQIRGRVGRSSRRAYAYFTFPRGAALSEIAEKRLTAIREFTEFGAGFKVALRDLEIRGAGNILGAEQHGHLQTVGYDMYMKLLNEAIIEEKGGKVEERSDCAVDLGVSAFLPESYVHDSATRIELYKKIASIENADDLRDVTDELIDRFGDVPRETLMLLDISLLRSKGCRANLTKIEYRSGNVVFHSQTLRADIWTAVSSENFGRILLNLSAKPFVSLKVKKEDALKEASRILDRYLDLCDERDKAENAQAEGNENKEEQK